MSTATRTLAGIAAGALLLGGCNSRDRAAQDETAAPPAEMAQTQGTASVRIVNVLGDQTVSLYADSVLVDSTAAGNTGSWETVPATASNLKVVLPGGSPDSAAAESSKDLEANQRYTAVVLPPKNPGDKPELRILEENYKAPEHGQARLRVINVITPGQSVDVFAQGDKDALVSGIDYESDAGLTDVRPLTGNLIVRPTDSKAVLTTIKDVNLQPGMTYTYLLTGTGKSIKVLKLEADSGTGNAEQQ